MAQWICTTPQRAVYDVLTRKRAHPREWELKVQSEIRSLRPPLGGSRHLLLGEDAEGIAAVGLYDVVDAARGDYYVCAVAVAARRRSRREGGSRLGSETLELILDTITEDARSRGVIDVVVSARIDPRNRASKRLCSAAGFQCLDTGPWGFERWAFGFNVLEPGGGSTPCDEETPASDVEDESTQRRL